MSDKSLPGHLSYYFTEFVLFKIGEVGITVSHLVVALVAVLISLVFSRIVRGMLRRRVLKPLKVDKGLEYAILQFVHYTILAMGVYVGLKTINLSLGAIVGLFAVLSVGIGFGLQNVAANFVSGIILLIERPVRVGDRIALGDEWGDIVRIRLRTTRVCTPDNVMIIVPNSHLLENEMINFSLGDTKIRLHVPVGVSYGSDLKQVRESLLAAAEQVGDVLDNPPPAVWFREFGDSSLNFELLAWIADPTRKYWVISSLNEKIDEGFRKAGIEIPFPQRDLHLRSSSHPLRIEEGAVSHHARSK